MQALYERVLRCVTVACFWSTILSCSDIKVFLAPCTVKDSGTSIGREDVLAFESEFLDREGYVNLVDSPDVVEFFDFSLSAFDGITCGIPPKESCDVLKCCNEDHSDAPKVQANPEPEPEPEPAVASDALPAGGFGSSGRVGCGPGGVISCGSSICTPSGCKATTPGRKMLQSDGQSILAYCFGDECKGFLIAGEKLIDVRVDKCGESREMIASC